jgi:hypothetical protein
VSASLFCSVLFCLYFVLPKSRAVDLRSRAKVERNGQHKGKAWNGNAQHTHVCVCVCACARERVNGGLKDLEEKSEFIIC